MLTLAKKANYILAKLSLISAVLLGIFAFFAIKLYKYAIFATDYLLGKIHSACGCQLPAALNNHHYIYFALIAVLGAIILAPAVILIIKTIIIYRRTFKFVAQHAQNKKLVLTPKLNQIAYQIGLENKIIEIESNDPAVFCSGFIKPRVYISSAIINSLSDDELKTVLLHEQHHLQAHEPIKLFMAKIVGSAFFFMPGVKSLARQYAVFSELAADAKATADFQRKGSLARALNKLILAWEKKMAAEKTLAVSFFGNTMEERINKLIDNNYLPAAGHNTKKIMFGFLIIGVLYLLGGKAAQAFSPALNSADHGNCAMEVSVAKNNCSAKNLWSKCAVITHARAEEKDPCANQAYANFIK